MDLLRIKYDAEQLNPPWSVIRETNSHGSSFIVNGKGQKIAGVLAGFRHTDHAKSYARKDAEALCRLVNSIHDLVSLAERAAQ